MLEHIGGGATVWCAVRRKKESVFVHLTECVPRRSTANAALAKLRDLAVKGDVTLVFAAKDTEHNQAVVLAELLAAEPVRG